VTILIFPVVSVLGGVLENEANFAKFEGGMYWQALVSAIWLTFLMIGIIVFLLYFFRERFNWAGPLAKSMAANVYTVYIVHQTILIALNIAFLSVDIPTIVKFFLVGLLAVPICFVLSSIIRRIPYAKRVLG
jgi:surface polysaccharide O-acyltransferase-like enzyme